MATWKIIPSWSLLFFRIHRKTDLACFVNYNFFLDSSYSLDKIWFDCVTPLRGLNSCIPFWMCRSFTLDNDNWRKWDTESQSRRLMNNLFEHLFEFLFDFLFEFVRIFVRIFVRLFVRIGGNDKLWHALIAPKKCVKRSLGLSSTNPNIQVVYIVNNEYYQFQNWSLSSY